MINSIFLFKQKRQLTIAFEIHVLIFLAGIGSLLVQTQRSYVGLDADRKRLYSLLVRTWFVAGSLLVRTWFEPQKFEP